MLFPLPGMLFVPPVPPSRYLSNSLLSFGSQLKCRIFLDQSPQVTSPISLSHDVLFSACIVLTPACNPVTSRLMVDSVPRGCDLLCVSGVLESAHKSSSCSTQRGQELEVRRGGSIYTAEIGKCSKSGLFLLESWPTTPCSSSSAVFLVLDMELGT